MEKIANAKKRESEREAKKTSSISISININSTLKVMDFDKLESNAEFKSVYSNSKTAKSYIKRTVSKW